MPRYTSLTIIFLIVCSALFIGCVGTQSEDTKTLKLVSDSGSQVLTDLTEVNSLHGSALKAKIEKIRQETADYHYALENLNPTGEKAKGIREIMLRFHLNANMWALYYGNYLDAKNSSDLALANSFKSKMMESIDDINNYPL